jgi:predicted membrane protein
MASRRLALVCLIATLFFLGILYKLSYVFNLIVFDIAIVLLFLGAVSIPLWHHSMRDKLISLIFSPKIGVMEN